VTSSDAPSCRNSAGKFGVWAARSGPGSSVLVAAGSGSRLAVGLCVAIFSITHFKVGVSNKNHESTKGENTT